MLLKCVFYFANLSFKFLFKKFQLLLPNKNLNIISCWDIVVMFDEEYLNNSTFFGRCFFKTTCEFFQSGGHGTASAIQLPKDIPQFDDGVKMSDPSSVSNDFDFNNILTGQIQELKY